MELKSSNLYLQNLMKWAVEKSKQFIMTDKTGPINIGDGGKWYGPSKPNSLQSYKTAKQDFEWTKPQKYIPSYWAGYYDRTAFYIRDFVHQAVGASYLGYDEENYQMLRAFISLADERTHGWAPWALNFDGSIYYMDTPNSRSFVRELTSQYELVETICNLYFITGDERYIDDMFLNFAEYILGDFTASHDSNHNSVPEGRGNIWECSASYNESGVELFEAGDTIAGYYKALLRYGELLKSINKAEQAGCYTERADKLKHYFNDEWSVAPDGGYVFGIDKNGSKHYKWVKNSAGIIGAESCFIIPLKHLTDGGERNDNLLEYIHKKVDDESTAMPNIESYTYLPMVFFSYNQPERGWYWMRYIGDRINDDHVKTSQGKNGDYPEISFTVVSNVIQGLFGIDVNVPNGTISTLPCLPDEISDAAIDNLCFGKYNVDISYTDKRTAVLTNHSDAQIIWECAFFTDSDYLIVDGSKVKAEGKIVNGARCLVITLAVPSGSAITVSIN